MNLLGPSRPFYRSKKERKCTTLQERTKNQYIRDFLMVNDALRLWISALARSDSELNGELVMHVPFSFLAALGRTNEV
jgi:hypothetical protein